MTKTEPPRHLTRWERMEILLEQLKIEASETVPHSTGTNQDRALTIVDYSERMLLLVKRAKQRNEENAA